LMPVCRISSHNYLAFRVYFVAEGCRN